MEELILFKKLFFVSMIALLMALTACGGGDDTASDNTNNEDNENASDFPSESLELIVPYSAGGGTDSLARSFADLAEKNLDESIAVVNRTGGGGAVGMQTGATAKPDGHTVTMVTVELLTLPHSGLAQFNYEKDFKPVVMLNEDPAAITVPADSPYDTIEEFVKAGKNGKEINIGNSGTGAIWHLAAAALGKKTGAEFNHVPFEGAAPAVTSLLGGHIDAVSVSPAEVKPQVEAGKLKVLAVMADERIDLLPEVPTLKEKGIDLTIGTWRGLAVPSETPEKVVNKLEKTFSKTAKSDKFKNSVKELGLGYRFLNAGEFKKQLDKQDELFAELIPSLNLNE